MEIDAIYENGVLRPLDVLLTAFKKMDLRAVHASNRPFKAAYP